MQYSALPRGSFTERWGNGVTLNFGIWIQIQSGPCEIFTSLTYLVFCCKNGHFYEFNDPAIESSDMNSADVLNLDVSALITIGGVRAESADVNSGLFEILTLQQRGI